MARYCLSLQKKFSMRWRALYISLSKARWIFAIALGWDHERFACCEQGFDHALVGIESFVCQQGIGLHLRQQRIGAFQIMGLARRQEEVQRIAQGVDQGMDFGAQSAFAAPDRLVFAVFFWAPALC